MWQFLSGVQETILDEGLNRKELFDLTTSMGRLKPSKQYIGKFVNQLYMKAQSAHLLFISQKVESHCVPGKAYYL